MSLFYALPEIIQSKCRDTAVGLLAMPAYNKTADTWIVANLVWHSLRCCANWFHLDFIPLLRTKVNNSDQDMYCRVYSCHLNHLKTEFLTNMITELDDRAYATDPKDFDLWDVTDYGSDIAADLHQSACANYALSKRTMNWQPKTEILKRVTKYLKWTGFRFDHQLIQSRGEVAYVYLQVCTDFHVPVSDTVLKQIITYHAAMKNHLKKTNYRDIELAVYYARFTGLLYPMLGLKESSVDASFLTTSILPNVDKKVETHKLLYLTSLSLYVNNACIHKLECKCDKCLQERENRNNQVILVNF